MYRVLPLPRLLALVACTLLGVLAVFLLDGGWASAQTDVPDAPTGVAVYSIESQKLEVRWSTSDAASTTSFKIQWKSGAEEYDSSRELSSDPATSIVSEQSTSAGDRYVDIITAAAGNDGQLTSAATGAVAAVVKPPLTARVHGVPSSHNGQDAFTFELRFSEAPEPDFSYRTVRDHAFTVNGGSVTYVRRLEPGKNIRWEITVTPNSSADVTIALNVTTDCEAAGAICTEDGRKLSAPLELTVNGPDQQPANSDPADLAPTNLAVRVAADGAALSWDAPAADAATVTGYRVLRSVGASAMTILADTGSDDTTYTDAFATTPGETYGYQVLAMRGAETSEGSNTVSASAPQAPAVPRSTASTRTAGSAPSDLTVTVVSGLTLLGWSAPSEDVASVTGYQILRSRADEPWTVRKANTGFTFTHFYDTWADWPGITYAYQIKALRGAELSEGSNQASLTRASCAGGSFNSTPDNMPVTAVPIVVNSTTQDYFVLLVRPDLEAEREFPISVTLGEDGTTTLTERLATLPAAHYRVEKYPVNNPGDVDGDCASDIDELADVGSSNPLNRAASVAITDGAVAIPDRETFERLSYLGTDGVSDNHLSGLQYVKFFIYHRLSERAGVYFMNTTTHRWHQHFTQAVSFPNIGWMRGEIVYHPNVVAPDGSLGVYRFEFAPWDAYPFDHVQYAYELLAASMPLLQNNLAYYPMPILALPLYHREKAKYDASRVNVVLEEDIFPDTDFISLNQGTGFGLLRVMAPDERPNPRDIVIYEALPNDLPRVAGIITSVPQTPLSHVNLRALQDSIPNGFIRDALDDATIDSLIDSHVRYTVTRNGYTIRAATKAEVDAHYEASRPAAAQTPVRDLTVTAITALSEVEFGDWEAFGVKAANVAVLGTLGFAAGTVPDGFAVPFYFYDEFMKANDLDAMVTTMLAENDFQASYATQETKLKQLRMAIKDATTPAWIITALEAMHAEFADGTSLRYRSSTNNEDLPGFSGAGLYDSKTQDPDETEEDGIDKSIKRVWASLWNFRAFVERGFNRIDHNATAMGVLVHPNYSDELANGVAVSHDPFSNRAGGYYVNTQIGEDLVTNPQARSVPEELLLLSDGSHEVIVYSNQVALREPLMSDAQLEQLRNHLSTIHDGFKALYAPAVGERFAMEIEFKITSDNVLAIKQARPWVFRPINEAPIFPDTESGVRSIPELTRKNTAIGAPVAATDAEGDTMTYTLNGAGADWFRVDSSSGQLRTEKLLDFETQDQHEVDVTVGDPFNAEATTITVTVNVTDVDEPADITFTEGSDVTANDNALTVDENHNGRLATFTASDPENTAGLTYQWSVVGTDGGDFTFTTDSDTLAGELWFAAVPDYEHPADGNRDNTYNIRVQALDSEGMTGRITVTVTVLPVNERPTITGAAAPSLEEEGTLLIGTYRAADPERATMAWQPLAGADRDKFAFNTSNGRLAFKAAPDFEDGDRGGGNVYSVTLGVSAGGHTTTFAVEVTVTNKEERGMLSLPSTQPQAEAEYAATLSDPDGVVSTTWTWERSMSMSRSGPGTAVSGSADSTTTSVYTPVTGDVGYYLRVTAAYTDPHSPPSKSFVAVSTNRVLAVPTANSPPAFRETNPTRSVAENARARATAGAPVTATDPDTGPGNTVGYELSRSDLFTVDGSSGQIRVKTEGALDYDDPAKRSHTVTLKASDSSNASATVQVTIEVTNVNEPPNAVPDAPYRFDEDTAVIIDVLANDSDPEQDRSELLLTVVTPPLKGRVTVNEPANAGENRTITYEPNDDYNGSDTFTYRVRDTGSPSLSGTATVSLQVDAVNDAPEFRQSMPARSVAESAQAGDNVGAPVTATDVDENDTLTYTLFGTEALFFEIYPRSGQITVGDGVTFDVETKDTYTVMVDADDGNGGTATVEVTITVTPGPTPGPTPIPTIGPTTSGGSSGGSGGGGRSRATPTPTPSPTPMATPTPTGPQFSGVIAAEPSVTATVVPEGTTLGLNGGGDELGGIYVNFPPTAVALPVQVSVSVSNEAPSDVTAPRGTTLLPLTIDITPETPLTLGTPLTIEINPTPEQLAAAGGDLNYLAVGVVTPQGIVVLPTQVMHGRLVVTINRLAPFVLVAITDPGPVLRQPPMGDASSMGPLLQWTQPPETTWFQVQVIPFNEDGPGINLVIGDGALVSAAQYQVLGPNFGSADPNYVMLPDMTYLWRVRTSTVLTNPTEADWSAWAVSSFKTPLASSSTIARVAPALYGEVSTLTPTLTWANSNAAVFYYEVQVSRDFEFGPNAFLYSEYVHGGASTPANSYVVPEAFPLEAGAIYYWRVRPRIQGDGDPLPWSRTNVFQTPSG